MSTSGMRESMPLHFDESGEEWEENEGAKLTTSLELSCSLFQPIVNCIKSREKKKEIEKGKKRIRKKKKGEKKEKKKRRKEKKKKTKKEDVLSTMMDIQTTGDLIS